MEYVILAFSSNFLLYFAFLKLVTCWLLLFDAMGFIKAKLYQAIELLCKAQKRSEMT